MLSLTLIHSLIKNLLKPPTHKAQLEVFYKREKSKPNVNNTAPQGHYCHDREERLSVTYNSK